MPVYTIATPDGRNLKIEADDEQTAIRGARQWSRENRPKRSAVDQVTGFMANVNRGMGVGDELAAGVKTAVGAAQDGLSGRQGPGLPQRYRNALRDQRAIEDTYSAESPKMAALGRGTGMAATAIAPTAPVMNTVANGSRLANAGRGAVAAAMSGAGYAAVDRGTARERLAAASRAARDPATLALGAAGGAMAPAAARPRRQRISDDVRMMREHGVELTPGQAKGGIWKKAEEAATSTPFAGDYISDALKRGQTGYNRAQLNDALKAVDEVLPDNIPDGRAAVKYTGDLLSRKYQQVLPEGSVVPDDEFAQNIRERFAELTPDMSDQSRNRLLNIIDQRVIQRSQNGPIDGFTFKKMESGLGTAAARFSRSTDVDQADIGKGLEIVREELQNAAARQNPKFAEAKDKIDAGWARIAAAETAAAASGSKDAVFTPARYAAALRSSDNSVRRRATARGTMPGQAFSDAAERTLSNTTPDSGSGRRIAQVALGAGGGTAAVASAIANPVGTAAAVGAAGAGVAATKAAYSPQGIALANRILDRAISREDQAIALNELRQMAAQSPEAAKLYQEVMRRLPGAGGIAANAPEAYAIP